MKTSLERPLAWLVPLALAACSGPPENPPPRCDGEVCTVEEGSSLRTVVDATDKEAWISLDLDTAGEADPDTPGWDLSLQRYRIRTNGGASGDGGVEVAILDDAHFEALEKAPAEGYVVDEKEDADGDGDRDYAFMQEGTWYDYDLLTHTLSPKEGRVYVVRTGEGAFFKLRMDGYYDADGASGHPSFTWAAVAAP